MRESSSSIKYRFSVDAVCVSPADRRDRVVSADRLPLRREPHGVPHDRYFMDKVVDHLLVFHGNADVQDFPGNYTDYREWKEAKSVIDRQEKEGTKDRAEKKDTRSTKDTADKPRKMTFKEKKEFEQIEQEIADLEKEKKDIEDGLSNGTIQGDELIEKSQRIGKIIDELDKKTMRWMELSEIG